MLIEEEEGRPIIKKIKDHPQTIQAKRTMMMKKKIQKKRKVNDGEERHLFVKQRR